MSSTFHRTMRALSRNAIKRIARAYEEPPRSSYFEGRHDAVLYVTRCLREGRWPEPFPDTPDFFGIYLSDSTSGRRYIAAYNDVIKHIVGRMRRRLR